MALAAKSKLNATSRVLLPPHTTTAPPSSPGMTETVGEIDGLP
jgi:hypothetical protein